MNFNGNESYRNLMGDVLDKIENEVSDIATHCQSGNYSMNEIAEELVALGNKLY